MLFIGNALYGHISFCNGEDNRVEFSRFFVAGRQQTVQRFATPVNILHFVVITGNGFKISLIELASGTFIKERENENNKNKTQMDAVLLGKSDSTPVFEIINPNRSDILLLFPSGLFNNNYNFILYKSKN